MSSYGIVEIDVQPTIDVPQAQAQVVSISQTIPKPLPAGITPPRMVADNASTFEGWFETPLHGSSS